MSRPVDVCFDMETQDPDDFLCLLFLASHPSVRLKAVTLVPGSQEQVGLVRWALERLGLSNVAVGAGNIALGRPQSPCLYRVLSVYLLPYSCPSPPGARAALSMRHF